MASPLSSPLAAESTFVDAPSPANAPVTPSRSKRRLSSFHIPAKSPAARRTPLSQLNDTNNRRLSNTPGRSPKPLSAARRLSGTPGRSPHHPSVSRAGPESRLLNSRRRSLVASTADRGVGRERSQQSMPVLSKEEIAQMYSSTIKLCQDNKINARNTWNLNLIDYMSMLFKEDSGDNVKRSVTFQDEHDEESAANGGGGSTNFQLAGVTLDAGVKIYCSRVDSVHTNAFKVLGGLSRTGREEADEDAEGNDGSGDDGDGASQRRKRKAKRTGGATLEANMGNITSHKLETDLAVDPLFQKMSAAFDEGGAKGMLLNNLPVGPSGQIIFDSGEPADNLITPSTANMDDSGDQLSTARTYDISSVLPAEAPSDADTICPKFLRFFNAKNSALADSVSFVTGSSQTTSGYGSIQDSSAPTLGDGDYGGAVDMGVDFDYDDSDMQNAGGLGIFPNAEPSEVTRADSLSTQFDGGNDDDVNIFGGPQERLSLQSNDSLAIAARGGGVDLVEAGVALREDSEYSFFDSSALSGWAGPQHWRFRATNAIASSVEESSTDVSGSRKKPKESKRPRGKTAMLLDFSREAPKLNFALEFAPGKSESANQLSKSVRGAFSEKKVTLPEDHHFSVKSLASLFLKPKTYIRPRDSYLGKSKEQTDRHMAKEGEGWYDFDNDCDNENFCPEDEISFLTGDANGITESSGDAFATGMDLVAEPTRVEKIDINYAKVAKKVDVRQLKSGMWSRLCGSDEARRTSTAEVKEVVEEPSPSELPPTAIRNSSIDIRGGGSQTLQELVEDMPSFVPEAALPDVSLSYVFICLLHLANEKTLKITQGGNDSIQDLIISTEEECGE